MKNDLTNLEHLRQTALEARGLIAEVAGAAAEAIEAVTSVSRTVILAAANWAGSGPYTQTAAVPGALADEGAQLVQIVPAAAGLDAWEVAGVRCTAQGDGKLTFTAREKPDGDLKIFVVLQEVVG